jgi:CHAT domain-containing protein/tetratricopeptide (TPR) repeat protein
MRKAGLALVALASTLAFAPPGPAAPLSVRDTFRIGTSGSSICSAQSTANDPGLANMFDAGYSLTCRDAALPVGKLYKLRLEGDPAARLSALRRATATCGAPKAATVEGIGTVEEIDCKLNEAEVAYKVYQVRQGRDLYVAEGLAGYDSALQLGLRSVVADQPVEGEVSVATTGAGDPAAFARVQAGTLDPSRALAEAYRRNNVGSYADAAEFFAAVRSAGDAPISQAEALINEALQKSNLGRYAEADALFDRASGQVGSDPLVARRFRNYRAMHLLNRGDAEAALKELDKPVPSVRAIADGVTANGATIDKVLATRLNAESSVGEQLGAGSDELLPQEKAEILDGQALQLRGTSLRLSGNAAGATAALQQADAKLESVRSGRVASVAWMRAQILGDLAAIAEESGNAAEADRLYRQGVAILEVNYPGSAALLNAQARLAGYLARSGQLVPAEAMFKQIVHSQADASNLPPSFARVLRPYLDILLKKQGDPAATAEIFATSQLMMRPGLAQTQAVLARELTGGTDEAARLFRQAVTLTRQVERSRSALARLEALPQPSPEQLVKMRAVRAELRQSEKDEVATQAELAKFPRYRAVSSNTISLDDFQKALRPGEAYYRMTVVGDHVYAMLITPSSAQATKLSVTGEELDQEVTALRDTIVNKKLETFPYDVALAHKLYEDLFAPFQAQMPAARHVIFEPDGAMLRMPLNPLVVDQASIDLYNKRVEADENADFDFRGVNWMGRDRDISTAVSPRSFVDLRNAPPASATKEYIGFGENAPPPTGAGATLAAASDDRDCSASASWWERPISATELNTARQVLARYDPSGVQVVTRDGFTDTAIAQRTDLKDYRIIHFATHGVVTSSRAKCPRQPALLTSFGGDGSDGLLTFRDIFDLRLDADLIILSACDTAGMATAAATQDAGLATGGDVALDGLVRAFVGAGGRLIIASHWPIPDNYGATEKLIGGLFAAPPGTPTVTALRQSERALMDAADTSHPVYWAAFAAVGDGQIPVIRPVTQIAQRP